MWITIAVAVIILGMVVRTVLVTKNDKPQDVRELSPEDVLKAIGVEVKEKRKDNYYLVAYQGGYFAFTFTDDKEWINITFDGFASCGYEHLTKALMVVNSINLRYWGWTCYLVMDSKNRTDTPLDACMSYHYPMSGKVTQVVEEVKSILVNVFQIAREFRENLKQEIEKQESMDVLSNNAAFGNKLELAKRLHELGHKDEPGEECPASSALSLSALMKLYADVEFGCLQQMKVVCDNELEVVTDLGQITAFDIREYVRTRPNPAAVQSLTLVISFEHQDLFVCLTKAKGSTDRSLFFVVNVLRSGGELNRFTNTRTAISSHTLLEVRLTDAEKDFWEAKFMIDDANDKVKSGRTSELSDEQRLLLSVTDPGIQSSFYWGKKFYNRRCYLQALYYFNQAYYHLGCLWNELNDEQRSLYNELCYYLGFIYMDLQQNDRAFYYLFRAKTSDNIGCITEFVNCLCNLEDTGAVPYIKDTINRVLGQLNQQDEEPDEALMHLYRFLNRRLAYALINGREYDEAEGLLNKMIASGEDVEFAKEELEYLKQKREEEKK